MQTTFPVSSHSNISVALINTLAMSLFQVRLSNRLEIWRAQALEMENANKHKRLQYNIKTTPFKAQSTHVQVACSPRSHLRLVYDMRRRFPVLLHQRTQCLDKTSGVKFSDKNINTTYFIFITQKEGVSYICTKATRIRGGYNTIRAHSR